MRINDLPIIAKFLLVLAVFGIFTIGTTIFSATQIGVIGTGYNDAVTHQGAAAMALSRASTRVSRTRASIGNLMISTTAAENASANADIQENFSNALRLMDEAVTAYPDGKKLFLDLRQQIVTVIETTCVPSIKAGLAATDGPEVLASQELHLRNCSPPLTALSKLMTNRVIDLQKEVIASSEILAKATTRTVAITYATVLGGLVVVMALGFFAIRTWVSRPLASLTGTMGSLSSGDLSAEVGSADRKDEIGSMSRAVQVFKDAGIEKLRLERQGETDRADAEAKRARDEQARQVLADQQGAVVQDLAAGLGRLAKGDLTCTLETPFAPDYERLRKDFNAAVDELRDAMVTITGSTAAIRSGTGEISQASDDLSRRTEQQAASLEETAAALDQITATVRRTAEAAAATRTVVGAATTEAERGEAVVRNAVTAMTEIEASARNISQIIGTIDEIAFQTNLLALNAGVEAARAGDAGRGFAVVASEVRALAQRSADAAKEIKGLIGNSSRQVDQGVRLVNDAGTTLTRILGQVTEINVAVTEIAASAQEQATGLAEVNTAVNQMDQVTQQNAAMVEQSTAASHALAQDTAELERLTARFNTGADTQPATTRDVASGGRSKRGPAPAKSLRVVGGNTARKVNAEKESWAEF